MTRVVTGVRQVTTGIRRGYGHGYSRAIMDLVAALVQISTFYNTLVSNSTNHHELAHAIPKVLILELDAHKQFTPYTILTRLERNRRVHCMCLVS